MKHVVRLTVILAALSPLFPQVIAGEDIKEIPTKEDIRGPKPLGFMLGEVIPDTVLNKGYDPEDGFGEFLPGACYYREAPLKLGDEEFTTFIALREDTLAVVMLLIIDADYDTAKSVLSSLSLKYGKPTGTKYGDSFTWVDKDGDRILMKDTASAQFLYMTSEAWKDFVELGKKWEKERADEY